MHSNKWLRYLQDYFVIAVTCFLYAFGFNCFFQPNTLAMGGFTGIAQILNHFFPFFPVGAVVFFMNVPLMILGVRKQGWSILFASIFAISVSSAFIDILSQFIAFPARDPLLACLYGGVVVGISLGWMLKKGATTGGTELAARLLKYRFHSLSIGKLCLIIDVSVICLYALTFRCMDSALYGILAMYVSSLVMDLVVYGSINGKLAYIISDHSKAISEKLMELGFGVTTLNGRGAYTGSNKTILMCAAKPGKMHIIKSVVTAVDPDNSFIIICDAREVFGEGFARYAADDI